MSEPRTIPQLRKRSEQGRSCRATGADLRPVPAPSTLMGGVAAASLARFAASGFKTVDGPLYELRMGHCKECEYRKETQCTLCRCFIAKGVAAPRGLPCREMGKLSMRSEIRGQSRRSEVGGRRSEVGGQRGDSCDG